MVLLQAAKHSLREEWNESFMRTPQAHLQDSLASKLFHNRPLYLITDGGQLRLRGELCSAIESALKGGNGRIAAIQLREQPSHQSRATDQELIPLAKEIQSLCRLYGAKLIINRNTGLARQVEADGIHLGKDGLGQIANLQKQFGIIAYSSHSLEDAKIAEQQGATFVTLSPIFKPLSKSDSRPTLGLKLLSEACTSCKIPVIALGGIDNSNIKDCQLAGASGVAMLSSVLLAAEPELAAKQATRLWD